MEATNVTTLTRVEEGRRLPVPGTYKLDPTHSEVGFVARHLVVTKVRGRFENWTADVRIGERIEDSSLTVTIEAASITTGNPDRDGHLRSPDFLDVENHPNLVFRSTGVRPSGKDTWEIDGTLEIRGVARPVTLEVDFLGEMPDPWGNVRLAANARTEIDREDWGLTWNVALETGGLLVSKKIQIEIETQALLA